MKPETLRANAAALAEMSDPPSGIIDSLTEAAAEIERLKADIADLLPMRDVDAKIISDQAAKIEWLKAKLAVEKEHHDYAMRKLHKTTAQAATLRAALEDAEKSLWRDGDALKDSIRRIVGQALATDAGKAAAEVIEVALKLAAYPAPYLPPARLLNELREAGKAYRAAVQPDG